MTVFHNAEPPWFESVKDLKPGAKRRIADGKLASFNGRAYHVWDFREKDGEVYEPQLSLAEKLAFHKAQRAADTAVVQTHTIPPGMHNPRDWPVAARVWLHKAGLTNDDIMKMGARWSAETQRVIIPLRMLDGTMAWMGRSLEDKREIPKYILPKGMGRGGGAGYWPYVEPQGIVITEDLLSAYRIARDTAWVAISAQGTSLDRDAVVSLAQRGVPIRLWLDPDYYGQLGARRIRDDLARLGVAAPMIVSDRDPKLHSPEELREYLSG